MLQEIGKIDGNALIAEQTQINLSVDLIYPQKKEDLNINVDSVVMNWSY